MKNNVVKDKIETVDEANQRIYNDFFGEFSKFPFEVVDPGYVLLQRCWLAKDIWRLKEAGVRLNAPWNEARKVYTQEAWVDYPKFEFTTKDNMIVKVDIAILVKIKQEDTDTIEDKINNIRTAMYKTKNIFEHIYLLIKDNLRVLFNKMNAEELIGFDISSEETINLHPELGKLNEELAKLKDDYCMDIRNIKNKEVDLPEAFLNALTEKEINKQKREAVNVLADAKVDVAHKEAARKVILAEAEAKAEYTKEMKAISAKYAREKKENEILADLIKRFTSNGVVDIDKLIEFLNVKQISASTTARIMAILGDKNGFAQTVAQLGTVYNQAKQEVIEDRPSQKILVPNNNQNK